MAIWEERDGLLVTSDPAAIQAELAAIFGPPSAAETAYLDSVRVYCEREMDGSCFEYGEHADWGWGYFSVRLHHDYDVNATESTPDWSTFVACPDEATACAHATAMNLGSPPMQERNN